MKTKDKIKAMNNNATCEKPIRVQRKRIKGWIMPDNTVYVGRGTKWGNPYKVVGNEVHEKDGDWHMTITCANRDEAIKKSIGLYESNLMPYKHGDQLDMFFHSTMVYEDLIHELKGKNLACFCPLSEPCHADVLLRIVNE